MKTKSRLLKYILPIIILAAGFVGMAGMVLSKTSPVKIEPPQIGTLVETITLHARDHQVRIDATGTVQPAMRVTIVPQVSGRVVRMADGFKAGGFIEKGRLLFEIEDADYRLAAEKSRSEIARAEYDLASVESQARVARLEWERVNLNDKTKPNPLVLHEPQLKKAQAALASAAADLRQRLLDIERTRIYAPFNCRVSAKAVDLGQYLTAGQAAATVAGTDSAEIVIPVPLHELQWLDVPRSDNQTGSTAQIHLNAGGDHFWQGRIDRSLGEVDTQSRMVRLVVKVDDPYGLKEDARRLDLAEGLFVEVILTGRTMETVFPIPASALRYGNTIWTMTADATLDIIPVDVLRREKDKVLVRGAIDTGMDLVTTQISGAAQGLRLRLGNEVTS
jgi:RND family efflux transporter MFP subunit